MCRITQYLNVESIANKLIIVAKVDKFIAKLFLFPFDLTWKAYIFVTFLEVECAENSQIVMI